MSSRRMPLPRGQTRAVWGTKRWERVCRLDGTHRLTERCKFVLFLPYRRPLLNRWGEKPTLEGRRY